ncbi:hypothetical protein P9X10_00890 [Bacillus cereus]|nr:hypothetical protein [Bacillus cereus]
MIDYNEFLADLLMTPNYLNKTVSTVVENNTDCQYEGLGYRVLFFKAKHLESLCMENKSLNYNELLDIIINSVGNYQSFSKTLEGTKVIEKDNLFEGVYKLVIKKQIDKGLDISKLYSKYENCLDEETLEFYEECKEEEEILAKMDRNYSVIEDELLKECIENYQNRN